MAGQVKYIFTSGFFDPLTAAHVSFFRQIKNEYPDHKLLVLLNSDEELIKKKGKMFMPFCQRYEILRDLKTIDLLISGVTTHDTIEEFPGIEIFAKSGDRNIDNIPESEKEAMNRRKIKFKYFKSVYPELHGRVLLSKYNKD